MTITYDNTPRIYAYIDGDKSLEFESLVDAILWFDSFEGPHTVDLVNGDTGEVLLTEEPDDYIEDEYDELDFNPYMGCYDFDY